MTLAYIAKLGLISHITNIRAQKIDGLALKTYEMIIAEFSIYDKLGRTRFFKEIFLLADTSMEMVLKISFLFFNNANLQFGAKKFIWRI